MSNDHSSTDSSSESRLERRRRRRREKRERKKKKERKRDDRKRKRTSRICSSEDDGIDSFDRERRRRRKEETKSLKKNYTGSKSVGESAESDEKEASATVSNMASVRDHRVKIEAFSSEKQPPPNKKIQSDQTEISVKRNAMVPMTREQHEAQQSQIREVYDEESGRYRLVRGTGEIIERIVSRSEHSAINQRATRGDGSSFMRSVYRAAKR